MDLLQRFPAGCHAAPSRLFRQLEAADELLQPQRRAREDRGEGQRRREGQKREGRQPLSDGAAHRRHRADAHHCRADDLPAQLARKLDVDPEGALERTNLKFVRRFNWIERELGKESKRVDEEQVERLEQLWDAAKRSPETLP